MSSSSKSLKIAIPSSSMIINSYKKFYENDIADDARHFVYDQKNNQEVIQRIIMRLRIISEKERKSLVNWNQKIFGNILSQDIHVHGAFPRILSLAKSSGMKIERALTWLGITYEYGIGFAIDKSIAKTFYTLADQKNCPIAAYRLAFLIPEMKMDYLKKAAKKALFVYADIGLEIEKTIPSQVYTTDYNSKKIETQWGEVIKYYNKAINVNYGIAYRYGGLCYFEGINVTLGSWGRINLLILRQDRAQALHNFIKAAALGCTEALADLGLMYENGFEVNKNLTTAKEFYQAALERVNLPLTSVRLGKILTEEKNELAAKCYCDAILSTFPHENTEAELALCELYNKHGANCSSAPVCFFAAVGLKHSRLDKSQNTRVTLNTLKNKSPDNFYSLYQQFGETYSINDLIDITPHETEQLAILFIVLTYKTSLPIALIHLILPFVFPIQPIIEKIVKEEILARKWIDSQKKFSSADMLTLFQYDFSSLLNDVDECRISSRAAIEKFRTHLPKS